jgi:hypothetical protein
MWKEKLDGGVRSPLLLAAAAGPGARGLLPSRLDRSTKEQHGGGNNNAVTLATRSLVASFAFKCSIITWHFFGTAGRLFFLPFSKRSMLNDDWK